MKQKQTGQVYGYLHLLASNGSSPSLTPIIYILNIAGYSAIDGEAITCYYAKLGDFAIDNATVCPRETYLNHK